MLRLSKKTDYALIALAYVASIGNKATSARDIAERHDIPVELLAKVLQRLVQKGMLKSQQGIHGGYVLARAADTMTVAEIVEAIDGPLMLTVCGTTDERCEQFSKCNIRDPLHRIRDRIIGALMACTIAELVSPRPDDPVAMPIRNRGPGDRRPDGQRRWAEELTSMVEITENASAQILKMLGKNGLAGGGLRVGLKAGGCSGYEYTFNWEQDPRSRRQGVRRAERRAPVHRSAQPPPDRRHRARLRHESDQQGIRVQQPEREEHLRLRHLFQRIGPKDRGTRDIGT